MAGALTGLSDSNDGGHGVGTALRGEVLSTWMTFPAHVAGFVIQVYAPGARRDVMPLDGHAAARSSSACFRAPSSFVSAPSIRHSSSTTASPSRRSTCA